MADFSLTDILDWANNNPGYATALTGIFSTLADPARPQTTTTTNSTTLPSYIAPYVGRMLNRAESISNEGYIPYGGQRLADFNDVQADYARRVQALNPQGGPTGIGAGIVNHAADMLMDGAGQRWNDDAAHEYMSPYIHDVIDARKAEAIRDWQTRLPSLNAAAARAGAYGGSRHGILQAEGERNLDTRLGDITAEGLNTGYVNAQQQFNADANRRGTLAGNAVNAGNTLSGIGNTMFQNQLASNSALLGVGDRMQQHTQQGLDIGYQNFLQQRDDPQNKLGIMQRGYQGLPMTQYATAQTTPAPSLGQQLTSAGIGGYALGQYGGRQG